MSMSRLRVNQLRRLDPEAWTELLHTEASLDAVVVRSVATEALPHPPRSEPRPGPENWADLRRYLLTIANQSEPVPLVGKQSNLAEAHFYRELARQLPALTPRCWLNHISASTDRSWLVLDDVPNHRPAGTWTADEVERNLAALVNVHATFWQQQDLLLGLEWLPNYLARPGRGSAQRGYYELMLDNSTHLGLGRAAAISAHALQTAGRLAPVLVRSAAGLETLRHLGGWPNLLEEPHLQAIAELLDDPIPMLQPLRELPITLLHGDPAPRHWHVTLFNERYLLDWHTVQSGPAVCELVDLLEKLQQFWLTEPGRGGLELPITEETMVDSYLLRMSMQLGGGFSARTLRQAIPAALCLYVLTTWLPRFAEWFHPFVGSPHTWEMATHMNEAQLHTIGLGQMAGLRPYLANLFHRFHLAARAL